MNALVAGVIGALTAVMLYLNGALAHRIGNYAAGSVIHLTGLLLITLMLLLTRSNLPVRRPIAPRLLTGGALGFLTVLCANVGVAKLGVALTLALGLVGQTVSALVIDQHGWFGASVVRVDRRHYGSLTLMAAGIAVMALA